MNRTFTSSSRRGKDSPTLQVGYAQRVRCCDACAERDAIVPIGRLHSSSPCPSCGVAPCHGVVGTRRVSAA